MNHSAAHHSESNSSSPKITWIASYPKSGNTWVRLFLSRLLKGEGWSIDDSYSTAPYWLDLVDSRRTYTETDLDDPSVVRAVARLRIPIQQGIRRNTELAQRGSIFLKTHSANLDIEGSFFSDRDNTEKSIYIMRDPRDVLISLAKYYSVDMSHAYKAMTTVQLYHSGASGAFPEFWSTWGTNVESWERFDLGPLLTLRYEDLSADPFATFRTLVDFLGWDDDAAAIRGACEATTFERLQSAERAHGFAKRPRDAVAFFNRGVAGAWRNNPNTDWFRRIEDAFGDQMVKYGYL